ncbi:putative F-box domain, galactose oxidase/kelch, beta-propeller, F-box associated interaction [Medicago truncatula]|uniref:F-box protein interaction domain protein n=1 Tax=Medicago truncatula TaxID=3880 RepID=G7IVF6_MEDTR|nr:F-box/kelch-repeat protein At3g23880 [Medicago truncatula]AES68594.1 F-box protein interaction domain protein [Medicago truncatula]RHN65474.1 putative F-box domain, galactose oxidase/kelch, beta-propeller, F-box associated interaction [Medicago truncatula]
MEMAQVSDSRSFTAETTTRTQLPTLPFDVLPEILFRLPVKLLVQLRCLCKFFNSLISDPKFAKKHLQLSTKRHHLMRKCRNISRELVLYDSPIPSVFSTSTVVTQTQLYPPNGDTYTSVKCSCDGIFCGKLNNGSYFLWNPSIRKFQLLPPLKNPYEDYFSISFGYDHSIDNYKVILVSDKNEVSVNTLGTDYWTRMQDIPYSYGICRRGVFVSGTLNWLALDDSKILSLDLKKESYQLLLLPDYKCHSWIFLDVVRDCLCISAASDMFMDVWIMKHYGNKESWTKLYTVPNMQDRGLEAYNALYISEDDQLLVECLEIESDNDKLVVYDSKTGTSNIPEFQNKYDLIYSNVYIESLISP